MAWLSAFTRPSWIGLEEGSRWKRRSHDSTECAVRAVHHDLPDVVVAQQVQGAVPGEVAVGALGDDVGIGQVEGPQAALVAVGPGQRPPRR